MVSAMVEQLEASLEDSIIIALTGLMEVEMGCGEGGRWVCTKNSFPFLSIFLQLTFTFSLWLM